MAKRNLSGSYEDEDVTIIGNGEPQQSSPISHNSKITPEKYQVVRRYDGSVVVLRFYKGHTITNCGYMYYQNATADIPDQWRPLDPIRNSKKICEVINSGNVPVIDESDWLNLRGSNNIPKRTSKITTFAWIWILWLLSGIGVALSGAMILAFGMFIMAIIFGSVLSVGQKRLV